MLASDFDRQGQGQIGNLEAGDVGIPGIESLLGLFESRAVDVGEDLFGDRLADAGGRDARACERRVERHRDRRSRVR